MSNWFKSPMIWQYGSTEYISVVFTWNLPEVKRLYRQETIGIKNKVVGGPAVKMFPEYFNDKKQALGESPYGPDQIFTMHNPLATRTSIGCPNRCGFCAVNKIHPKFKEFKKFLPSPIVCDDNFLACSDKHFDMAIDRLKVLGSVDFNQGLDASLMDPHKASRFAELSNPMIRLAWDNIEDEKHIVAAVTNLRKAGIPRNNIRCYVLIGFNDTPGNALYRLNTLRYGLGIKPNPMRYQPFTGIHCLTKNSYVHPNWTHKELDRFMSYWSNLRFVGGVPFGDYIHRPGTKQKREALPF
jgi:hypothetical protein